VDGRVDSQDGLATHLVEAYGRPARQRMVNGQQGPVQDIGVLRLMVQRGVLGRGRDTNPDIERCVGHAAPQRVEFHLSNGAFDPWVLRPEPVEQAPHQTFVQRH
jgi:hypothetical protein